MDIATHTKPHQLERYSFLWSEARLVIAALALFLGGVPPLTLVAPSFLYGFVSTLLTLSWLISGVASAYLLYRWLKAKKMLFGAKATRDTVAFLVSVVSGFNLGLTGLFDTNIGMSISSNKLLLIVVGLIYLAAAYHLHKRVKAHGGKLFA